MVDYKSIYDDVTKRNSKGLTTKIASTNKIYDTNAKVIEDNYTSQIEESNDEYDEMRRENAVDRKVNEHYIAEEMANTGRTDSGLNRTQITANTLSYSNKKAEIDRQRQAMVDRFKVEMEAYIAENENSRTASIQSITDAHEQSNVAEATGIYNTQVEAETAAYKAEQERLAAIEKAKIKAAYSSSGSSAKNTSHYKYSRGYQDDSQNDISVFYNDGKEYKFAKGTNPYTGDNNLDEYSYEAENFGFFSNGYQPKGIEGYGTVNEIDTIDISGREHTIWYTDSRRGADYWIWDDEANKYVSVKKSNGNWILA